MIDLTLPPGSEKKILELREIAEQHPDYIPLPSVATFLGANAEGLRKGIEEGTVPWAICWQKETKYGKTVRPGSRAFKIPTVKFWLWYTNNAGYQIGGLR